MLKFLMITSDPDIARFAVDAGVDRLFIDLEQIGKAARQSHVDSWKSSHTVADIAPVRRAVPRAEVLVRINPLHDGTAAEVEAVLDHGADWIMQPMWRDADAVRRLADLVRGRARLMPLAETADAVAALPDLAGEIDAAMIGLNDLHLDRGLDFMFQPFADGSLDAAAAALRNAGTPFGVGGIARAGEGHLPPEILLGEHVRLGSEWVILSRTFHRNAACVAEITAQMDFAAEIAKLRDIYAGFAAAPARLDANRQEAARRIEEIAARIRASR